MIAYGLILASLIALSATWRYVSLRLIAFCLLIAASVTPWSSGLPIDMRSYLYIAIDLVGAFVGLWIWSKYRITSALVFMVATVAACVAHFSWFASVQSDGAKWSYIALLNALFLFQCVWITGDGIRKHYRDGHFGGGADRRDYRVNFRDKR
jgi:hypothetical protein